MLHMFCHVIAWWFFFSCGENQCSAVLGEVNGLCACLNVKLKMFSFSFLISSPLFSTPNFQAVNELQN